MTTNDLRRRDELVDKSSEIVATMPAITTNGSLKNSEDDCTAQQKASDQDQIRVKVESLEVDSDWYVDYEDEADDRVNGNKTDELMICTTSSPRYPIRRLVSKNKYNQRLSASSTRLMDRKRRIKISEIFPNSPGRLFFSLIFCCC